MLLDVEVKGFRELDATLKRAEPVLAFKILRGGVRAGLSFIRKQARANLRSNRRTGELARRIRTKVRVDRASKSLHGQIAPDRDTFYGMFLEFGTRFIPAQPWLRPAADNTSGVMNAIGKHMRKNLEKAFRRGA